MSKNKLTVRLEKREKMYLSYLRELARAGWTKKPKAGDQASALSSCFK